MNRLVRLLGTTIGRKIVMAATGVALLGFVLAHMAGNLLIYNSPEALNDYAAWLQGHPLLWVARIGLLAVFLVHLVTAASLILEKRRARPVAYAQRDLVATGLASRTMALTGALVLFFVVLHLAHFTFGAFGGEHMHRVDAQGRHDVHAMVVGAFENPFVAGGYVAAMLLLGFHLLHGLQSSVQTLGFNHGSYNGLIQIVSRTLVAVIVVGNCSFPVLIQLGVLGGGN